MLVAYSEIEGFFARIATEKIFPDAELLSCHTFHEAYEQVEKGNCEACVLPVENSYAGEIGQVSDLMFAGTLKVTGVYELHVSQCLLGVKGSIAATIRKVISHPQALEQCGDYITRSGYEAVPYENTARAAKEVARRGDITIVAVGARSAEDQQHRLTASAISSPVGMKNPPSGDYAVMLNAILAASHPHTFIYRGWEIESKGNPYTHAILRGYTNKHGEPQPNYHFEDLIRLSEMYEEKNLLNPAAIIDTNHSNSAKNPYAQPRIIKEVLNSMKLSPEVRNLVKGFMVESYIEDGCQKVGGNVYGQSNTDPCPWLGENAEINL